MAGPVHDDLRALELEAQIHYRLIERLSASERRYRGLVESLPVAVLQCDREGRIQFVNPAWRELTHWPANASVGRLLTDFLCPEDRSALANHLAGSAREAMAAREVGLQRADGKPRRLQIQLQPEPEGWVGTIVDVTAWREAEDALAKAKAAAEEANLLKTRFLANISHELRTPMSALMGFSSVLVDEDLSAEERRDCVARIRQNGERLLTIVNDLLDYSELTAGRLRVHLTDCQVAQLVADVAERFAPVAESKRLEFTLEVAPEVPETLVTDGSRLSLALGHLVQNALKFTDAGRVHLAVRPGRDPAWIAFEVHDTGPGIPPEQLPRLMEPFRQADDSATRTVGGSGLGLAIVNGITRLLGGTVAIASEPGRGSTFTLLVPQGVPAKWPHRGSATHRPRAELRGRVLLAEDTPDMAALLQRFLRRMGLEVVHVRNGAEARDRALTAQTSDTPFDVVLMDMQMPVLDGYHAVAELRRLGYRGTIVAVTAHSLAADRDRCLDAGCDDYVAKPVGRKELGALLARFLPIDTPPSG